MFFISSPLPGHSRVAFPKHRPSPTRIPISRHGSEREVKKERKKERKKKEERRKKEEGRTRRQKQVPFHNRTHTRASGNPSLRFMVLRPRADDIRDLSRQIEFKRSDGYEWRKSCEHLKRLRTPMKDEMRLQPNTKYLESVADQLGLTGTKPRPTPGVPTHRAKVDATPFLTDDETRVYRSCVGALKNCVLDRADVQLEVSILGSYMKAPTTGAKEALRKVTRYLLGATWFLGADQCRARFGTGSERGRNR